MFRSAWQHPSKCHTSVWYTLRCKFQAVDASILLNSSSGHDFQGSAWFGSHDALFLQLFGAMLMFLVVSLILGCSFWFCLDHLLVIEIIATCQAEAILATGARGRQARVRWTLRKALHFRGADGLREIWAYWLCAAWIYLVHDGSWACSWNHIKWPRPDRS